MTALSDTGKPTIIPMQDFKYIGKSKQLEIYHEGVRHDIGDEYKCYICREVKERFEKEFVK